MIEVGRENNRLTTTKAPARVQLIGGIQAYAITPGTNFEYNRNDIANVLSPMVNVTNGNVAVGLRNSSLWLDPENERGATRIVGVGIEIVDTTAEIARQGMITTWRSNEPKKEPSTYIDEGGLGDAQIAHTRQVLRYPPSGTAEALIYPASAQWRAQEGAYMPGIFSSFENPLQLANYVEPTLIDGQIDDDVPKADNLPIGTNQNPMWVALPYAGATGYVVVNCQKIYPYQQMGAILTGLASTATVTIRANFYVEYAPCSNDQLLLPLARMSSPYDPVALEFLSRVNRMLAVAVPAGENWDGEFWSKVVTIATTVLGGGLAVVNPALGAAIMAGGGALAGAMRGGGR